LNTFIILFFSIAEDRSFYQTMSFMMLDWASGKQNFALNSGPNNAQSSNSNPLGPSFPQNTNNNSFNNSNANQNQPEPKFLIENNRNNPSIAATAPQPLPQASVAFQAMPQRIVHNGMLNFMLNFI